MKKYQIRPSWTDSDLFISVSVLHWFGEFHHMQCYCCRITCSVVLKAHWFMFRISHSSCQPALNHSHDHERQALTTDTERLTLTVWHPEEHFKFISASASHMTDQVKVQRFCHVILKRGLWAPLSTFHMEILNLCQKYFCNSRLATFTSN